MGHDGTDQRDELHSMGTKVQLRMFQALDTDEQMLCMKWSLNLNYIPNDSYFTAAV